MFNVWEWATLQQKASDIRIAIFMNAIQVNEDTSIEIIMQPLTSHAPIGNYPEVPSALLLGFDFIFQDFIPYYITYIKVALSVYRYVVKPGRRSFLFTGSAKMKQDALCLLIFNNG